MQRLLRIMRETKGNQHPLRQGISRHRKGDTMDIEQVNDILDEIAETLPPEFFRQLNGGILLLPEEKHSPVPGATELYVMGEYCVNSVMGRCIKIYYGSFEKNYGNASEEFLRQKLREVLLHEFTHHFEHLGGEKGLEIEDARQINAYLNRKYGGE